MSDTSQWHYTDRTGQQVGPATTDELVQLIQSQVVPTSAMAWKDGMPGWKPVSQIEELQTAPNTASAPAAALAGAQTTTTPSPLATSVPTDVSQPSIANPTQEPVDPYKTPNVPTDEEFYMSTANQAENYGGIGRLAYFLLSIVVAIITQVITFALGGEEIDTNTSYMITGGSFLVSMFVAFSRFKNIGMSRWWFLGNFVPILNIFVSVWILSRQEGWVETQELDTAGKIIAWIMWTLILLSLLAIIGILFFLFTGASA